MFKVWAVRQLPPLKVRLWLLPRFSPCTITWSGLVYVWNNSTRGLAWRKQTWSQDLQMLHQRKMERRKLLVHHVALTQDHTNELLVFIVHHVALTQDHTNELVVFIVHHVALTQDHTNQLLVFCLYLGISVNTINKNTCY